MPFVKSVAPVLSAPEASGRLLPAHLAKLVTLTLHPQAQWLCNAALANLASAIRLPQNMLGLTSQASLPFPHLPATVPCHSSQD